MAMQFSSHSQPFVTNLDLYNIKHTEQDLKDVEIVYLEVLNDKNGIKGMEAIGNIFVGLQTVEHTIKKFNDVELCFSHIYDRPNVKIYLILSHSLIEDKMLALKECAHVIFVYDFSSPSPWIKEEGESGERDSLSLLFNQVNIHHRQFHYDIASENSTELLPQSNITHGQLFLKYQLLMQTLCQLPVKEKDSKREFVGWSYLNYSTNPKDRETIEQFARTFTSDQAIQWYTKQSFVNRILGRTFASNDLHRIYKVRYFILHLYTALKELYAQTFAAAGPQILVYRGKVMSISEFAKLRGSIGKLIITKSFVSTSLTKDVARLFSGHTEVTTGNVAVIFRMKIDMVANKSKAVAFIGEKSSMPDENEVLLGPGIIFLNKSIEKKEGAMFIVDLIHTSVQENIEERIIRSNADNLERAQGIQSPEAFASFFDNVLEPLNEQATPQLFRIQNDEQNIQTTENQITENQNDGQNNQTMEPPLVAAIQHQTTEQTNEQFAQTRGATMENLPRITRRLREEIDQLRRSSGYNGSPPLFIIDRLPTDFEEEEETPNVIIVRVLPKSPIYNQCAYQIEIELPTAYPFNPPEVRFVTPIYHPNVGRDGTFCLDILRRDDAWSSTKTLLDVIEAVTHLIDHPDVDSALDMEAAYEYVNNRAEFDRKALEMV